MLKGKESKSDDVVDESRCSSLSGGAGTKKSNILLSFAHPST